MQDTDSRSPAEVKAEITSTAFDWRKHIKIHPAAELFPLMRDTDPAGFAALDENIRVNGLQSSIVLFCENGKERVLDGRNRLDALARSGRLYFDGGRVQIEHHPGDTFHPFTYRHAQSADVAVGCDPYAFVLSANIHRRHLTPALKDELIAKVLAAKPELSNRQIGAMTKTDKNKVAKVRTKMESTGEVAPVEKTVGKDGRKRKKPVKKVKPGTITKRRLATKGRSPGLEKLQAKAEALGFRVRCKGAYGDYALFNGDGTPAVDGDGYEICFTNLADGPGCLEKAAAAKAAAITSEPVPPEITEPHDLAEISSVCIVVARLALRCSSLIRDMSEVDAETRGLITKAVMAWQEVHRKLHPAENMKAAPAALEQATEATR